MKPRPHLLIFNPDQWRGDVLGHLGNPAAVTPVLDALVRTDAVSFANAFCQNPVCTPSRCSFMTGLYPHTRGHRTMHYMLRESEGEKSLLRRLKESGYTVFWAGKNDLVPGEDGFEKDCDVYFRPKPEDYRHWGFTPRPDLHRADAWRGRPGGEDYYGFLAGRLDTGGEKIYCDNDWAMVLGAVDYIRNYKGEKPLCVYLPLLFPHPPYGVEDPFFSSIDSGKLPPRVPAPADWSGKPMILEALYQRQGLKNRSETRWTELRAAYYGMCARVDHQFGLVLDALREKGLYDDTAVFFFSDHGDYTGDFGIVEKTQNTFEDCLTRVPFVFKPPGGYAVKPGMRQALVELVDFTATVFRMTGLEPGYDHFGKNLAPLLEKDDPDFRDAVFCEGGRRLGETQAMERESLRKFGDNPERTHYWPRVSLQISDERPWQGRAAMVRTREYKYVMRLYEDDELCDLKKDPHELNNVADQAAYAGICGRLRERLLRWYMETCDAVPRKGDSRYF